MAFKIPKEVITRSVTTCVFVVRRFAASGSVTAEEQEQRVLYANVLEYEQDHVSWSHFISERCIFHFISS